MQKRKIKIGLFPAYPLVNHFDAACDVKFPSMKSFCNLPGIIIEIYQMIANDLNLQIEAYDYSNKSIDIMFSDFDNGTIDLNGFLRDYSSEYDRIYDFSEPLYEVETHLVVRRQDTSVKTLFDFFNVFGPRVWLMFTISFLLFITIGLVVQFVEWRLLLRHQLDFFELIWRMARLQLIQNEHIEHKLVSGNFLVITFSFLQCALILGLYNTSITSAAVKHKDPHPFKTKELFQVLSENRYTLAFLAGGGWMFSMINNSLEYPYYDIREATVNNKVENFHTPQALLDAVNTDHRIAALTDDNEAFFVADRDYCDLVYLESPFPLMNKRIRMLKGNPLMSQINASIIANRIAIQRIYRKYKDYRGFQADSKCNCFTGGPKILHLQPYLGVLLVYGIGLTSAVLAFSCEVLIRC